MLGKNRKAEKKGALAAPYFQFFCLVSTVPQHVRSQRISLNRAPGNHSQILTPARLQDLASPHVHGMVRRLLVLLVR